MKRQVSFASYVYVIKCEAHSLMHKRHIDAASLSTKFNKLAMRYIYIYIYISFLIRPHSHTRLYLLLKQCV
jgi:hypothetical protein